MNKSTCHRCSGSFTLFFILLVLLTCPIMASASAGIDPWVEEQFQGSEHVEFIVRLRDRADLTDARAINDVLSRRTLMVERLQSTAKESQANLRNPSA